MKKLIALVRSNLLIQKNTFLDVEPKKLKKKVISTILMGLFVLCSMEIYVWKSIELTSALGIEIKYIFYSIVAIEVGFISVLSLYRILNLFYLTSSTKDIFIYPVKDGMILLSKFILVCYQNIVISAGCLIPLATYGVLTEASIGYYLKLIIYQILLPVIPSIYIILISLTLLWIITVIKKSKVKSRVNKLILILDMEVGILTYVSIKNTDMLILSLIAVVILNAVGFYFIAGSVYLTIMRSEIFVSRKAKVVEENVDGYKFEKMNKFKSNFIRDMKMLKREKALKTNCLTTNFILSSIYLILLLEFGGEISKIFESFGIALKTIFFIMFVWPLSVASAAAATSFSREGSALKVLRTFPLDVDKYILEKFCVALVCYVPSFIFGNVAAFKISANIVEFIALEGA